jgi:phage shock protein C
MYCTGCGREMEERDRFCPSCGKPVHAAPGGNAAGGEAKRLYRPARNKKIAGVCAGFAQYLGVDVTMVRIVWLIMLICYGVGLMAYLIAWIAMPREDSMSQATT